MPNSPIIVGNSLGLLVCARSQLFQLGFVAILITFGASFKL
jgi:hypothetical protein